MSSQNGHRGLYDMDDLEAAKFAPPPPKTSPKNNIKSRKPPQYHDRRYDWYWDEDDLYWKLKNILTKSVGKREHIKFQSDSPRGLSSPKM